MAKNILDRKVFAVGILTVSIFTTGNIPATSIFLFATHILQFLQIKKHKLV